MNFKVKLKDSNAVENCHTKLRALSAKKRKGAAGELRKRPAACVPACARARLALWPRGRVGGRKGCGFSRGTLVLGLA